jgi:HPt (histidine-containing phosphotransfer) domain-containing protein
MEAAGSFSIPGLFDVYLEHGEGYLHAIGKAIQAQEPTDLERNAHAFKGSCGYVGATHLSKLCQQLEDMGKGGVLEGAPALYQEVQQEFHRVQIALKEYYPDETAEETRQTEDILDPAYLSDTTFVISFRKLRACCPEDFFEAIVPSHN